MINKRNISHRRRRRQRDRLFIVSVVDTEWIIGRWSWRHWLMNSRNGWLRRNVNIPNCDCQNRLLILFGDEIESNIYQNNRNRPKSIYPTIIMIAKRKNNQFLIVASKIIGIPINWNRNIRPPECTMHIKNYRTERT